MTRRRMSGIVSAVESAVNEMFGNMIADRSRFGAVNRCVWSMLVAGWVVLAASRPASAQPPDWQGRLAVRQCETAELTLPGQTAAALESTLLVRAGDGIGSAVLVSPDGFALTAAHVVAGVDTVTVVTHQGGSLTGHVVRVDANQDVALIKIDTFGTAPCLRTLEGSPPIGSDVFVLGSPGGEELSFSVAKGIVSAYRDFSGLRFIQLDASVNPGNSGGPAVDSTGRVIGIASWKISDVSMEGLAFAVPVDVALASLEIDFAAQSSGDWASLGGRRGAAQPAAAVAPAVAVGPATGPATGAPRPVVNVDHGQRRRQTLPRSLIGWGIASASLGALAIGVTAGVGLSLDQTTSATWTTLVAVNTAGYVLVGTGAALLTGGLIIRSKRKREMAILPTLNGVVATGSF
jgi:S1-C subfamily serine protease